MQNCRKEMEVITTSQSIGVPQEHDASIEDNTHFSLMQKAFDETRKSIDTYGSQSAEYLRCRELYGKKLLAFWIQKMRKFQLKREMGMVNKHLSGERYKESPEEMTVYLHEGNFSFFVNSDEFAQLTLSIQNEFHPEGGNWILDSFKGRFLNAQLDEIEAPVITSSKKSAYSWSSEGDISFYVTLRQGGIYSIKKQRY